MPSTYTRCKTSRLSIKIALCWIFCMGYQIAYAHDRDTPEAIYGNKNFWSVYPVSLQIAPHLGIIPPLRLLDVANNNEPSSRMLVALGGRADISLLYARRWLWEHFDCYPKVGLLLKYDYITNNNVAERGHVLGGALYLEPNYNHLDGWEVLPRAGVGISYLNIPGGFSSLNPIPPDPANEEEKAEPYSAADVDAFRQEIDLNLIFDILVKYRLTPRWHLHFSLGLDYFPALFTDLDNTNVAARSKKAIEIYTASLGCSYTFNPTQYNPIRAHRRPKNLVDIALLNSFRKAYLTNNMNAGGDQQQSNINKSDQYYYLGGLHVQWSYQLVGNHALVFGSEWIKDWALKKELEKKFKRDNLQISFMLGHEFLWGKLQFGQYLGVYVLNNTPLENYKQFLFNDLFYARFGLNYRITEYLYVGTNLKVSLLPTNKDIGKGQQLRPLEYTGLDYLDCRIGFSF